jgi:hypothetical protein
MSDTEVTSLVSLGMNDKHLVLRNEFLRKLHSIIQEQDIRMKSYAIAEDYSGCMQETVSLTTPSFSIQLQVTARNK